MIVFTHEMTLLSIPVVMSTISLTAFFIKVEISVMSEFTMEPMYVIALVGLFRLSAIHSNNNNSRILIWNTHLAQS